MSFNPPKGQSEKTFTRVDDDVLIRMIGLAVRRLVFVAPGVRLEVARALTSAMDMRTLESLHIVLDVDSEVSRLGYGDKDMAGLELLQAAAAEHGLIINHHPGIRIGLLIADDTTLIYSPTPLLIEAGSQQADKPNAIMLQAELPVRLAGACGLGEEGPATLEVGNDPINSAKVQEVKRDLEEHPPKEYNIARVERVFNSMLHYVELRIEDYKLTSGLLILRKDVNDFEKEIKVLKAKIEAYKSAVQDETIKRTDAIVEELLTALKESLRANPPDHWRKRFTTNSPTDADIKRLFEEEVHAEVKRVKTDFDPRIFYAYKDVTYQTFQDEKFRKLMEEHFGKDAIDRIFSEYDAAPEQKGK
jgi:hypothetical protein